MQAQYLKYTLNNPMVEEKLLQKLEKYELNDNENIKYFDILEMQLKPSSEENFSLGCIC